MESVGFRENRNHDLQVRPKSERLTKYFRFRPEEEPRFEVRNTLLVVASLITTATYQAALSPPGGLWEDSSHGYPAGTSIMAANKLASYVMFVFFNSVGFFLSLFMIIALTGGFPMRIVLALALQSLIITYDASMAAIAPNRIVTWIFYGISVVLPIIAGLAIETMKVKFEEKKPAASRPPV
ncbi:hypothetical protein M9H77_33532 [Catharanthus roseus]|uniref:Uncharacterized protein n=1 Tax=Catharanthus roseus TaxID=4058 RepID=A0ACB9ZIS7_CATRO|nr:hypothetical protein M9H77_33532 [Catharanthus roseus]